MPGLTFDQMTKMGAKPVATQGGGLTVDQVNKQQPDIYQRSQEANNPLFPAAPSDFQGSTAKAGLTGGLKAAGNLIPSAWNMAKGVGSMLIHPIDTASNIIDVAKGAGTKLGDVANEAMGRQSNNSEEDNANKEKFSAVAQALHDRYGSVQNAAITAENDPFGLATDILGIISGGAGLADRAGLTTSSMAKVVGGIEKTGGLVEDTIGKVAAPIADKAGEVTKFGVSQATGLNPETVSELARNPEVFSKEAMANTTRENVANDIKSKIDQRLSDLSETGKEYQGLRENTTNTVKLDPNEISKVLDKYNIKLDANGNILENRETLPMSSGDKNSLQDFLDKYVHQRDAEGNLIGQNTDYTGNSFLNARKSLSEMAKYDMAKTDASKTMAKELRSTFDAAGKEQLPGLKDLDAKYAPEVKLLGKIRSEYLDASGNLKDTALTRIANLNNKGRELILNRLEQVAPGVSQKVKVLKAVEDIKNSSGFKVGTYFKGAGAAAGAATGNIPMIVASIMATPEIAVPLIKGFGLGKAEIMKVLDELNNFKIPGIVSDAIDKTKGKAGLSIKDVSGGLAGQRDLVANTLNSKWDKVVESVGKGKLDFEDFKTLDDYKKAIEKGTDIPEQMRTAMETLKRAGIDTSQPVDLTGAELPK